MLKPTLFSASFFIFSGFYAQIAPSVVWQNTIGANWQDIPRSICATNDGGCIIGGDSFSDAVGDKTEVNLGGNDFWIIKLDSLGNIEWQNTIGGSGFDYCYGIRQCADGSYFAGGHSSSSVSGDKTQVNLGGNDIWILKLDSAGNILWQRTIGSTGDDQLFGLDLTADGGFILGCTSNSNAGFNKSENSIGSYDYWIVKLDSLGFVEWDNTIGGTDEDDLADIRTIPEGGYIVGGSSKSGISGDKTEVSSVDYDYWILQLDATGNIVWQKTLNTNADDICYGVAVNPAGGFYAVGSSSATAFGDKSEFGYGFRDYWVVQFDNAGNKVWDKSLGGDNNDYALDVIAYPDGGCLLTGYAYSGMTGNKSTPVLGSADVWLVRLNGDASIRWQRSLQGISVEQGFAMCAAADGGVIHAAGSDSGISGDKTEGNNGLLDYWIVKTEAETETCAVIDSIYAEGETSFCAGGSVTLHAPVETGFSYTWYRNGNPIPGAHSASLLTNKSGTYSSSMSNGTCEAFSGAILVTRNPNPNANISNLDETNNLCEDPSIKLRANNGPGFSWQWYKGGLPITGETNILFYAEAPGNYRVAVTTTAGCTRISPPYAVFYSCRQEESISENKVHILPNPSNGNLTVTVPENGKWLVQIWSANGAMLYAADLYANDNATILLHTEFPSGIYTIVLQQNAHLFSEKWVIQ
ncbi:MAG: T9SS type A sorting domain-containing protein [Chitinophagales bacterium]